MYKCCVQGQLREGKLNREEKMTHFMVPGKEKVRKANKILYMNSNLLCLEKMYSYITVGNFHICCTVMQRH